MTETELIHRLQSGDEPAFRSLVQEHQHRVYNTVLGFLQDPSDAEEATQDVFIKVHQHVGTFKGESSLTTWIYRIAVTTSLDALRKRKRKGQARFLVSLFGRENETAVLPDFYHPGVAAEQKEDSAFLFRAIRTLPDNQQAAFLLQKLEGLSQPEIAEVLKTSVSAVESLLHRAKAGLRKTLHEKYSNR